MDISNHVQEIFNSNYSEVKNKKNIKVKNWYKSDMIK